MWLERLCHYIERNKALLKKRSIYQETAILQKHYHFCVKRRILMAENRDSTLQVPTLKLYSFWLSSCSHRIRFALNLKGLKFEYKAVKQYSPELLKLNPMNQVPVLVDEDIVVADSFAILMYLEDKYPQNPLLPNDVHKKAINFQASSIVFSSIQPIQNFLQKENSVNKLASIQLHIGNGFTALEKLLQGKAGKYATGDEVFLADLFIAPQIYAAKTRFKVDMTQFPLLSRLYEAYNEIPAFQAAMPEKQPDASLETKAVP